MMLKLEATYGAASATAMSMSRQASSMKRSDNPSPRCLWIVPTLFIATPVVYRRCAELLLSFLALRGCLILCAYLSRSLDYSLSVFRNCQIWRSSCSSLLTACNLPGGSLQAQSIGTLYSAILLQQWPEDEAGGEAEEVAGGEEEGDPMLRVKAAMSLERSSKNDQKWVRLYGHHIMASWRSWTMALCLSSSNP